MNPAMSDSEKSSRTKGLLAPPPGSPGYHAVYHPSMIPRDYSRNARRRRFWHFFACAVLFVAALRLLRPHTWNSLKPIVKSDAAHDWWIYGHSDWQCAGNVNWTGSSNVDVDLPDLFHAHTTFELPVASEELYFVAEGARLSGSFEISQTADAGSDSAIVDISVAYYHPEVLNDATVCRLHSEGEKWGLGIFRPHGWPRNPHHDHNLRFHVHLRLPADDWLTIKSLRTNLPLFAHNIPEFAESVFFDEIHLRSANAMIRAVSVAGKSLHFQSSNGAIYGSFNTSKRLELVTSNAPIGVHATLVNNDDGHTTQLSMKTSNGRITADVNLTSSTSHASKARFDVGARTSNAALELSFVDAPVDSVLTTDAHTSNSPARVALYKTYEGNFTLRSSSFFRPEVQWDDVDDPAGRGRQRKVNMDTIRRGTVRGSVKWGEEEQEGQGSVSVETTNSPLRLIL